MKSNELTEYMNHAIRTIISDVIAQTISNPQELRFLIRYRKLLKYSLSLREQYEKKGVHIPSFLICSITNMCNLHCVGCYARQNGICSETSEQNNLSAAEWKRIFKEASQLGISFIILAGGEPLMRKDILESASFFEDIIFPIFTNSTLIDENYCEYFSQHRNLVPIISIEGKKEATDQRRGEGIYALVEEKMHLLANSKILFGVSFTVTKNNLEEVTSSEMLKQLEKNGCRAVFFIEYVPVDSATISLALGDEERMILEQKQRNLRKEFPSILFLSFPGDEKNMGGCIAAGRGFFHINYDGEAQACPFSPYSDRNLRDYSLREVLESPFFHKLREENLVGGEHTGGCTLFYNEKRVLELQAQTNKK